MYIPFCFKKVENITYVPIFEFVASVKHELICD